jgi:hypothetical protein
MTHTQLKMARYSNTLVSGGHSFEIHEDTQDQSFFEAQALTLTEGEAHSFDENETVKIETIQNNGIPQWVNYHFKDGGSITGPARFLKTGTHTQQDLKWKNYKSEVKSMMSEITLPVIFAVLATLLIFGPIIIFSGTSFLSTLPLIALFPIIYVLIFLIVVAGTAGNRYNMFKKENASNQVLKSVFFTTSPLNTH